MYRIYASAFALSGAAGLIYESVWSHYLKLVLGHAAYAQTLVLAIFMGAMAIGSWLASRFTSRLGNLLIGYAAIEFVIGVYSLGFHKIYLTSSGILLDTVLPALEPGIATTVAKLSFATLLILPQSILLGATFPLLTGGLIRRNPEAAGSTVALLYFANSIGAVAGVIGSGFWLVPKVGLPGAILTAAVINVLLALLVYVLARHEPPSRLAPLPQPSTGDQAIAWIIIAAAVTGAASFCYEIAWIRMLSMVLGASTHSFELMLAAFILGLALGGLWIKKRIDRIADPKRFLGLVQLAMGALAVLTLPLYDVTFDVMAVTLGGLGKSATAYTFFSLLSHGIALLIMLPATFCAGMTLPLLTLILMRSKQGERAIGQVYAANTLGSILGVLVAVHLVLPGIGLKGLLLFGTLLDGALGAFLVGAFAVGQSALRRFAWAGAFVGVWLACLGFAELDPRKMGSGVYRVGRASIAAGNEVVHWQDGKTASISLVRQSNEMMVIATNGKPDASVSIGSKSAAVSDEPTQILAGVIPMLLSPKIETVANIGLGSGMTMHTTLAFSNIKRVDTIEIEPAMVETARKGYGKIVSRAFEDPRGSIHIDDARAYFSGRGEQYDLIISEPSNPWVSGVASLFTEEFYAHVTRYLKPDGYFVQWLQLYETDSPVVASITSALDASFADYAVYASDAPDLLIVARVKGEIPKEMDLRGIEEPDVKALLDRVGITGEAEFSGRILGTKATWSPTLAMIPAPANSDFFPYVDHVAPKLRFQASNAVRLLSVDLNSVPVLEALKVKRAPKVGWKPAQRTGRYFQEADLSDYARRIRDYMVKGVSTELPTDVWQELATISGSEDCTATEEARIHSLDRFASRLTNFLNPEELATIWAKVGANSRCFVTNPKLALWFDLIKALGARNFQQAGALTDKILEASGGRVPKAALQTLYTTKLLGHLLNGEEALFVATHKEQFMPAMNSGRVESSVTYEVVLGQALVRNWKFR